MKIRLAPLQAGCIAACCMGLAFSAQADKPELPVFAIHAFAGGKILDKDDWAPADQQFEYGGEVDFQPGSWPIALTAGYYTGHASGDPGFNDGDFKSTTTEIQAGVKKFWQTGRVGRAFAGGGVTFASAKGELQGVSSKDNGVGGWIGGGYIFELGRHFDIGVNAKYSYAKATVEGIDTNAGGVHAGVLAGLRW